MSELRLACGEDAIRVVAPGELEWTTVAPRPLDGGRDGDVLERAVARQLEATWPSAEAARLAAREGSLVIVPDGTRRFPHAAVVAGVCRALAVLGVPRSRVRFLVAGGVHAGGPPLSLVEAARRGGAEVAVHDGARECSPVGRTAAGSAVALDRAYLEAGLRLVVGGTSLHYFAGFGGGPKMIFPGVAARPGVAHNHRLSLAPHPPGGLAEGCAPGRITGNPVARDIAEGAAFRTPEMSLHLVPAAGGWTVETGDEGLRRARLAVLRGAAVGERQGADCVLASAGGAPLDGDLVQAHKALFHAAAYCRPGGAILLAARLERGAGSPAMERWLSMDDGEELERRARADYDLNAQTAISLRRLCARHTVLWLGAREPGWVRRAGAVPVDGVSQAWRAAGQEARRTGRYARGVHLPQASAVVPADVAMSSL